MLRFFTASIMVFACLAFVVNMPVYGEDEGLFDQADFELKTAADLAEVCNAPPEDPLVEKAVYFCLGFVTGLGHYHAAISQAEDIDPITCPDENLSRIELALTFLRWYEKNPQFKAITPEDAVMRAAAEKWPCK